MLHYLIQLNYAALLVIFFMLIFLTTNHFFDRKILCIFRLASISVLGLIVVDSIEYWTASFSYPTMLRVWMSAIGYSLRPAIIFLLVILILRVGKKKCLWLAVPLMLNTLIAFSALFTDISYSYSAENQFVRGPLGYSPFAASAFYLIVLFVLTVQMYKTENTSEASIILAVTVSCMLSAVLESVAGYDGVINVTGSISMMVYYLYLNTQQFKRDALTNALNRRCFFIDAEKNYGNLRAIISIDLNDLKQLNDQNGHAEGDRALCTMVSCIKKSLKRGCYLYRTGGDEFMILCFKQSEQEVKDIILHIKQEMSKTPYSCAVGMAYVDTRQSLEKLCAIADKAMYEDKMKMKEKSTFSV